MLRVLRLRRPLRSLGHVTRGSIGSLGSFGHVTRPRVVFGRLLSSSSSSRVVDSQSESRSASESARRPKALTWSRRMKVYGELSKFKLSTLVVVTTAGGLWLAGIPSLTTATSALVGTSLAAACANTFNQVREIEFDAQMKRTRGRPLPANRITPLHAKVFGVTTGVAGTGILALGANPLSAGLALTTILLYTSVYTPLKRTTQHNTLVGAVVGSIPPVIGWTAGAGTLLDPEPAILFAVLFAWQYTHFLALAWLHRRDYANAGYKMLPLYDPSGEKTALVSIAFSAAMLLVPVVTTFTDITSGMFLVDGTVLNAWWLLHSYRFYNDDERESNNAKARKLFRVSLVYLPLFIMLMFLHAYERVPQEVQQSAVSDTADNNEVQPLRRSVSVRNYHMLSQSLQDTFHDLRRFFDSNNISKNASGGNDRNKNNSDPVVVTVTSATTNMDRISSSVGRRLCPHESIAHAPAGVAATAPVAATQERTDG